MFFCNKLLWIIFCGNRNESLRLNAGLLLFLLRRHKLCCVFMPELQSSALRSFNAWCCVTAPQRDPRDTFVLPTPLYFSLWYCLNDENKWRLLYCKLAHCGPYNFMIDILKRQCQEIFDPRLCSILRGIMVPRYASIRGTTHIRLYLGAFATKFENILKHE
jgi:hypothetical protein